MSRKVTQKFLRSLIRDGIAEDARKLTDEQERKVQSHSRTRIGHAEGIYGCNGIWFVDNETGIQYVVPDRSTAMFSF